MVSNRNNLLAVFTRDIRIRLQAGKRPRTWETDAYTPRYLPIFHHSNPSILYERTQSHKQDLKGDYHKTLRVTRIIEDGGRIRKPQYISQLLHKTFIV